MDRRGGIHYARDAKGDDASALRGQLDPGKAALTYANDPRLQDTRCSSTTFGGCAVWCGAQACLRVSAGTNSNGVLERALLGSGVLDHSIVTSAIPSG